MAGQPRTVALVGNPNCGKSTLFNALTGKGQKVGNYAGVTVTRATGRFRSPRGEEVRVVDLPGSYSLAPQAPDEEVTYAVLHGAQEGEPRPDVVLCVVDASALERHLPLVMEVAELGLPVVVALNRVDLAEAAGVKLDPGLLSERVGVEFVPCQAHRKQGLVELKHALDRAAPAPAALPWLGGVEAGPVAPEDPGAEATRARFGFAKQLCQDAARREGEGPPTLTDRLDRVLLHPVFGWVFFVAVMFLTFWALFSWAEAPMTWIEDGTAALGERVRGTMPQGDLRSLLVDGVIGGVGGVLVFLPQIAILFFLIGVLESTGYMARAAYLMDGPMAKAGLSGRSFIPLLSSYACAIPGIMAARTIGPARGRLITVLIAPWMSCSARLPVYALMIALLFPAAGGDGGGSSLVKPLVLFGLYAAGTLTALAVARLLRAKLGEDENAHFMLEFPDYHAPRWGQVVRHTAERAWAFVRKAGTIILGLSILIWAASTYPRTDSEDPAEQLNASAMGVAGRAIEPVVAPLGFDWRIGAGVLTSFAAREVFNSTMAITFAVDDEEDIPRLREKISAATWPDGRRLFTPLTCVSLLVFYIYALQCLPTTAVVRRETGSWKIAIAQFVGMGAFAYVASLVVYQGGRLMGLG